MPNIAAHGYLMDQRNEIAAHAQQKHRRVEVFAGARTDAGTIDVRQFRIQNLSIIESYLPQRRKMMQAWADHLDALRKGAKVLPFKAA
jgi:ribosomal protein L30E